MNAAVAISWLTWPRPAKPANSHATAHSSPTAATTRVQAAPLHEPQHQELGRDDDGRVGGEGDAEGRRLDAGGLRAVRGETRLELAVAGEEQHEAEHAQLHHGAVAEQRPHAAGRRCPVLAGPRLGRGRQGSGTGRRTVAAIPARTRNIAASMENSSRKLPARSSSTSWPPMSPPMPSPRFCRKNCRAKARVRSSAGEHQTINVASAGCSTAVPAPSRAAEATTAATLAATPMAAAPTAATSAAPTRTGRGPRRSMARPVKGSTASAAMAKTASTAPAAWPRGLAPAPHRHRGTER